LESNLQASRLIKRKIKIGRLMATNSLLDISSIAKSYGPVVALKNANLEVQPGEIHALLGATGAEKSTLV
jgi:ribose transport system ATP-binding protein